MNFPLFYPPARIIICNRNSNRQSQFKDCFFRFSTGICESTTSTTCKGEEEEEEEEEGLYLRIETRKRVQTNDEEEEVGSYDPEWRIARGPPWKCLGMSRRVTYKWRERVRHSQRQRYGGRRMETSSVRPFKTAKGPLHGSVAP